MCACNSLSLQSMLMLPDPFNQILDSCVTVMQQVMTLQPLSLLC